MFKDHSTVQISLFSNLAENGFSVGVNFVNGAPTFVHSTYAKVWVDHYVERKFVRYDPTVLHGITHQGHFTWKQLREKYPESPVFDDAEKFGMPEGNTISISIDGAVSIASATGPAWTSQQIREAKAALCSLHHLHAPEMDAPELDDGVVTVIRLMADGLRDEEIGERLNLSTASIRKRRIKANAKLNASTPANLVAKAIKSGVI